MEAGKEACTQLNKWQTLCGADWMKWLLIVPNGSTTQHITPPIMVTYHGAKLCWSHGQRYHGSW
jgi:hypothetical protein